VTNYAYSIVQTKDGGYALGGYTASSDPGWSFRLLKIDVTGNVEWNENYGTRIPNVDDMCARAIQTKDGGFAIAGSSKRNRVWSEFLLIKTDEKGIVPEFPSLSLVIVTSIVAIPVVVLFKKFSKKGLTE
jgi:hypothetical protein